MDEPASPSRQETAVFAGGCFWGVQVVFQHVKGVSQSLSGQAGGSADTARYDDVSSGATDHAESVRIVCDPAQVTYGRLLQIHFSVVHYPTQRNRQGLDIGAQSGIRPARSAIVIGTNRCWLADRGLDARSAIMPRGRRYPRRPRTHDSNHTQAHQAGRSDCAGLRYDVARQARAAGQAALGRTGGAFTAAEALGAEPA